MRAKGWVSLISSSRWRAAVVCSSRNVRVVSRSGAIMAEEAKKLAAYAAVDNHVQVPSPTPALPAPITSGAGEWLLSPGAIC